MIIRTSTYDQGMTVWRLSSSEGGDVVGSVQIATPSGNPGVVILVGDDEKRFDIQHACDTVRLGYAEDDACALVFHRGGGVEISFLKNLPDAASAPEGADLENVVIDKSTGKLYMQ